MTMQQSSRVRTDAVHLDVRRGRRLASSALLACLVACGTALGQATHPAPQPPATKPAAVAKPKPPAKPILPFPPQLAGGQTVVTDRSDEFLRSPVPLDPEVAVARTAPTVTFMMYPGQDWEGKPWSNWGDSLVANGKYYASISDHLAPDGRSYIYEFDPATSVLRPIVDIKKFLQIPDGTYSPGKVHGRIDVGSDGWLYYSTHRGSTKVSTAEYGFKGDWILRTNPATGESEVVVHGPVPMHCIPNSVLDPDRLIFYGGTTPGSSGGSDDTGVKFFAYDTRNKRMLTEVEGGPSRSIMFARSTGRVYYVPGRYEGPLMRFDPAVGGPPQVVEGVVMGNRAATQETPQGIIYSISAPRGSEPAEVLALDTKTETVRSLGVAGIGREQYMATIDADPTGRYLYYVPGAHGGGANVGAPVVQFDTTTGKRKVIAFLAEFYKGKYGVTPKGTYSVAVDETGGRLFVTWNVSRLPNSRNNWDSVAMSMIEIPESERQP